MRHPIFLLVLISSLMAAEPKVTGAVTVRIANRPIATYVSPEHVVVVPRLVAGAKLRLPETVKRRAAPLDQQSETSVEIRLEPQANRTLDERLVELARTDNVGEVRLLAWDNQQHVGQTSLAYQITSRIIARIAPSANPLTVFATHGCDPATVRPLMPGVYVATARGGSPLAALRIAETMGHDPAVVWSEVDLLRAHSEYTPNDPLLGWQWHLNNDGTVTGPATTGNDIRALAAWDLSSGINVNIGVVDSGIEWIHDDLAASIRLDLSKDFVDNDSDPSPAYDPMNLDMYSHGTFVAGLAAARGNNGIGMCGVAPLAGLVGLRSDLSESQKIQALGWKQSESLTINQVHVSNNSYGNPGLGSTMPLESQGTLDAYIDGVTIGRNGKGIVYIVSAGNNYDGPDNVCYDGGRNVRHIMAIGALSADGTRAPYSETGCALTISAPGGDATTYGLVSVDQMGAFGYNTTGNYTTVASGAQGTSFAAPIISGVAALMLSVRPELSWRDVHMIMMRTARKNDPGNADWLTTGSSLHWNFQYGFGCVDAAAAVAAAQSWTLLPDEETITVPTITGSWPIDDLTTLSIPFPVTTPADLRIETVEFTVALTHPYPGDLVIELESPTGLRSLVPQRDNDNNGWEVPSWTFLTRAHLSELASGTWTLRITDLANGDTGQLQGVGLRIHGYRPYAVPSIVSISPSVISLGSADTQVTIAMVNPAQSAQTHDLLTTVMVGGVNYSPTLSGSDLRVTIPAAVLATAGTYPVVVTNPTVHGLGGGSASASIVVNTHPVATPSTLSVTEDITATDTVAGTDANGDALTYSIVSQGSKGIATITNSATGAFTYAPSADNHGADAFTVRVTDIYNAQSTPATITVTIAPVNDPPVLGDLAHTITTFGSIPGFLTAADVDGDALTYTLVSQTNPAAGNFSLNPATGSYIYISAGVIADTDTLVVQVNDGALIDTATISISIIVPPPVVDGGGDTGGGGGGCGVGGAVAVLLGVLALMRLTGGRRPALINLGNPLPVTTPHPESSKSYQKACRLASIFTVMLPASVWAASVVNPVLAPNPNRIPMGDIGALEAGAIVARCDDAAATYYNPAGLVRAMQPSISGNASLYEMSDTTYNSNGVETKASTFNVVPAYVGAIGWFGEERENIKPQVAWGLAITNPVAWRSVVETSIDNPSHDYYLTNHGSAELNTLAPTVGIAFAIHDDLSLGMSVQGLYTSISYLVSEVSRNDLAGNWDIFSYADNSTIIQARAAIGASWRPTGGISIGAQIRSPSLLIFSTENMGYDRHTVQDAGTPTALVSTETGRVTGSKTDLKRPWEVSFGLGYRGDTWSAEVDISGRFSISTYRATAANMTIHSIIIDALGNRTEYDTTYTGESIGESFVINGSIGGSYRITKRIAIHGGAFTDRSSVEDSTTFSRIDLHGINIGVSYTGAHSSISLGCSYITSNEADAGYAFNPDTGNYDPSTVQVSIYGLSLGAKYFF